MYSSGEEAIFNLIVLQFRGFWCCGYFYNSGDSDSINTNLTIANSALYGQLEYELYNFNFKLGTRYDMNLIKYLGKGWKFDYNAEAYNISINELETSSNNLKKIDYKTFSSSHPMHVYTYSAKDVLVLPSGTYDIKIHRDSKSNTPILIRVSKSGRKSKNIVSDPY